MAHAIFRITWHHQHLLSTTPPIISFFNFSRQKKKVARRISVTIMASRFTSTSAVFLLNRLSSRSLGLGAQPLRPLTVRPCTATHPLSFHRGVKTSIVDWEPVKQNKDQKKTSSFSSRVFIGLLCLMPIISFGLGTWQVKRLRWKTDLISEAEDRLTLPPLPLPPVVNPKIASSHEFDYRRVVVKGTFRHDQEMYVLPRMRDGKEGFFVLTPLVRSDGSKLLINRGWIAKKFLPQETRPLSLPQGEVEIECLLRKTPEKNFFTPDAPPIESPMYHFMDINDMSRKTDCQPIYIEELLDLEGISKLPDIQGEILSVEQIERRGIPVGSSGKVEFRNTHFQYILTWYGLSVFTTIMLFTLFKQSRQSTNTIKKKLEHARKTI